MRCPYCAGLNSERSSFCAYCGRDLAAPAQANNRQQSPQPPREPQRQQPVYQPQRSVPSAQGSARTVPPYQQPRQAPVQQTVRTLPSAPPAPPDPEPPAQFPSRTIAQLKALEPGALAYKVVDEALGDGRKKIVRIVYRQCAQWQQVATLLKAFNEQQKDKFDTVIVQGVLEQDVSVYNFTNGQLRFDRNVRLGSQIINRYQIETGNGLESDSVRIVLSE